MPFKRKSAKSAGIDAERTKPFRLVKYFTFMSLGLIFVGTVVLSLFNTHWIRTMQTAKSEAYALLLIENLNHQVFMQFILPVGIKFGKIELRNKDQFQRMDSVVRSTLHSFNVEMVNIYGVRDVIAYSFSKELIGLENLGGASHQNALAGKPTSKLVQQGSFWELFFGVPKEIKINTFAPLRMEKPLSPVAGEVLGVVEIVQDLSDDYKGIFKFQVLTLVTVSAVMSVLFFIMITVVKRGEGIIRKRAQEQLHLKEQLSRTKHLSSLGEMVAGVSHEIRNPLGIISSSAELLEKKITPNDPMARFPAIIIEESSRLNTIITDFLNYARPKEPNRHACRIEDVIDKNIRYLSAQTESKGYAIHTRFDKDLPILYADMDMLYQAFLNIFINAMQAMPDGGQITVWARSANRSLWIAVEDTGQGIDAQVKDKIWDPFFTTKDKGTGLGLGIVKNIIEAHQGRVHIDNHPEGGARVSVRLPINGGT
ncbi:MAG: GHKL domain-containing protein [Desulfatitalea sp.]|nr:GHKL domain-containing protein [Desulfatitalea sp.]NNK00230.1 GHKL domain-containing protein [Desulfatitalea sp.]